MELCPRASSKACSPLVRRRNAPKDDRSPPTVVSRPQRNQRSVLPVCTWRKAPYGAGMASQRSPSYPGVEPKAWGRGWRGRVIRQRRGVCQGDSTPPSVLPGPGSTDPGSPLPLLAFGPMFCPHFACSVATVS